jgi:hypothetical protein
MPCTFVILFSLPKQQEPIMDIGKTSPFTSAFFPKHFNYISMAALPKNLEDEL